MARPKKDPGVAEKERSARTTLLRRATALHMLADPAAPARQDDILVAALKVYVAQLEAKVG